MTRAAHVVRKLRPNIDKRSRLGGLGGVRIFLVEAASKRCGRRLICYRGRLIQNTSSRPESPKSASHIEVEGRIIAVLPGTMFRVQLLNGHVVLGHISGKLRKHFIKIAAGDMVKMEMSPYDTDKARITFRIKDPSSNYRPPARRRY